MSESAKPKNEAPLERSVPGAPLESILCTEELNRRPSRPPDYEKENSALVTLVGALADSPGTILQTLAETILEVTQSDSAGLSLLTKDEKRFYWPAIAGVWSPHIGGGTPRDFGPCGDVLDRNCTLLFKHFEQRYPYFQPVTPLIEECLLVPFYVDGRAVGTIWAITHSDRHKFDAEDDRVMASLGKFASSAYQAVQSIDDLRFQVAEREKAEKELRELTDGLETQVRARTEELEHRNTQLSEARARLAVEKLALERSEAYLAEAERLSHTGSWHWNFTSGEAFWSKEFFSIFGFDSKEDQPSNQSHVERIHPEDRANVEKARLAAITEKGDFETEYRLLLPGGSVKHVYSVGRCSVSQSGDTEFTGAIMDITERKRAEATIRRSEKELRDVIETIPTSAWTTLADGSVEFVNRGWREYTGLSGEGSLGSGWQSAVHPEDMDQHVGKWQKSVATGDPFENEVRYRRSADGKYRWFLVRAVPLRDEQGNILKWYGISTDIEERKRAEAERESSEARYRLVIETASDAVISTDESGSILLANPATARIFGYAPAELIGKPLTVLMPESERKLCEHGFRRYLATGHQEMNWQSLEKIGRRQNGQEFPVELSLGELIKDGQHVFTAFIRDISERKRAEEALRSSEAFLAEAQRLSHTGSWHWDIGAGKVVGSKEHFAIFGVDSETNEGSFTSFTERVHPEDRRNVEERVWAAVNEKRDWELECRLLLPGGVIKHIHDIGHRRVSESGGVEYIGTAMDITERKRADQERERLRQVLADLAHINRVSTMGELTASLAHEIKQPISAALTNAETCVDWLALDQPNIVEGQEAASRLIKDLTRASNIITRIGSLYKKGVPLLKWVNVNELIQEMIALLRSEAARYSISVHGELADGLPKIMADRVGLQQVLMNLMVNGIEAMKDTSSTPGKLTISSEKNANNQLVVSVADTGVGLQTENANQIFNAFFTSKSQGTGMGLTISRSIIESHGGRLWAIPNPGSGATFQFVLPVEAAAPAVA
jgi:PAS domain S-box-containing protein